MKKEQVVTTVTNKKWRFIEDYMGVSNAATGSKYDANANVTTRNIATLSTELGKEGMLKLNYSIMYKYIEKSCSESIKTKQYSIDENYLTFFKNRLSVLKTCLTAMGDYNKV